jgi:hypothetical protein
MNSISLVNYICSAKSRNLTTMSLMLAEQARTEWLQDKKKDGRSGKSCVQLEAV